MINQVCKQVTCSKPHYGVKISANAQTTIDKTKAIKQVLSINTKNTRILENFKAFNSVTNLALERINRVYKPATYR